jgi:hypothetical protein
MVIAYALFNDVVTGRAHRAFNNRMINEKLLEKNVEGTSRDLTYGTILIIIWRFCGSPGNNLVRRAGFRAEI